MDLSAVKPTLRKYEEKAPCFSAGMNPTPLPQTTSDVLNGCFKQVVTVLPVNRGGLPALLIGQYRDSSGSTQKAPLSAVKPAVAAKKYLRIPCRDRSNGCLAQPVVVF